MLPSQSKPFSRFNLLLWAIPLALIAGIVFFTNLGKFELNDWDEAWHAEVAREILTHGEWASLYYRDQPYFNKPPLSFWMKAAAFKVFGVNEFAARFFPACLGFGSVLLTAWFAAKIFSRPVGFLAGLILCSSWLFTLHHAGRSAETDSTLIFFLLATVIALWYAQINARLLLLAAFFTAMGWLSKGATAYLAWPIAGLGWLLNHWCGTEGRKVFRRDKIRIPWRHLGGAGAILLLFVLPWQIFMLLKHGSAFFRAFYISEGALPAFEVYENHPGGPFFYYHFFHQFFEPWLTLAVAGSVGVVFEMGMSIRRIKSKLPIGLRSPHQNNPYWNMPHFDKRSACARFWIFSFVLIEFVGASLFATKMLWYATPALPGLAILAAYTIWELTRRRRTFIAFALIAFITPFILNPQVPVLLIFHFACVALILFIALILKFGRLEHPLDWPITIYLRIPFLLLPLYLHFTMVARAIVHNQPPAPWVDLCMPDEPWRNIRQFIAHRYPAAPICLINIRINPAAYFYLHQLPAPVSLGSVLTVTPEGKAEFMKLYESPTQTVFITREEYLQLYPIKDLQIIFRDGALVVFTNRQ